MENGNPDPPIRDDGLPDVPGGGYTPQPALSDEEKRQLGIPVDITGDDDSFDPSQHQSLRHEWQSSDSSADFEHYTVDTAGNADVSANAAGFGGSTVSGPMSDSSKENDGVTAALGSATESIDRLTDAIKSLDVSPPDAESGGIETGSQTTEAAFDQSSFRVEDDRSTEESTHDLSMPSVDSAETRMPSVSDSGSGNAERPSSQFSRPASDAKADRPSLFDDPAWRELRDMAAELRKAESSGGASVSSSGDNRQDRQESRDRVAPLVDDDAPLVPQQNDATEIRRQYRRQGIKDAMYSASNVANGIANANSESKLGAGAGMKGISGALSAGGSAIGLGMGPAGIALASAAGGAATALNAVMTSASNAASTLAKYSGQMSVANAKAHVNQIVGDVNRAQILAPGVSRYTEATSKLSEMAQNAQAAFLKAALDKIVPAIEAIVEGIETYGPKMLEFFIDALEGLDAIIQVIPAVLDQFGIAKAVSKTLLESARNLRELNDRDRKRDNKDTEMFLDQFLQAGGMGIDPNWQKPHNQPPNHHPAHQNIRQILNMPFVNGF